MSVRGSWYRDGDQWVVVLSGMPEHSVKIGVGDSVADAWSSLESTPLQSVGPDSGEASAIRWAVGAGWISDYVKIEEMPECWRDAHREAGNWGTYPANGATRRIVSRDEADEIIEADKDGYASIVREGVLESADDDDVTANVSKPVGDIDWSGDIAASYVSCVYGAEGNDPGDCYVRVGEDELGLWWTDDGDSTVRQDVRGPYASEDLARDAAVELADEQGESNSGEDADDMRTRLLEDAAGEPDGEGEWCVYWDTALDDEHVVDRYDSRDAAEAAATLAQIKLERGHPGGNLLCAYVVRRLVDDEWIEVDDA